MEKGYFSSVTRLHSTQFQLVLILFLLCTSGYPHSEAAITTPQELHIGFKATPDPSISSFQPLLRDPSGNLSLGFLRIDKTQLALSVLHLPSSEPLWVANPTRLARWSDRTELTFNGSLVISDPHSKLFWSTQTKGERVLLLNSSNLQILGDSTSVLWQSFDFPTNTLVENQNFSSQMKLVSSNGLYSMRLGDDFIGLFAEFNRGKEQIYWKHSAMETKAAIVKGKGPIYARVNPDGYLGMYQTGTGPPVDVQPFSSFQRTVNGLLKVRLEPDGNLKGYYWDGSNWVLNYQAISNPDSCELPSPCGSYGLCKAGSGCSCLDNRTEFHSGECFPSGSSGDFCRSENDFWVVRRKGVELPFKELMRYETTSSLELCEGLCEKNCSCWGAVYNNGSGFCYLVDYPIQTLLGVGDETKVGYFKVREGAREGKKGLDSGPMKALVVILGGVLLVLVGLIGYGSYRIWIRRRGMKRFFEEETGGVSPGPYKDLASASFRSIEMGNR
ncbi:hypothetical protein UlMin_005611 [Ulmus minor]